MFKKLAKLFFPSANTLAGYAADGIAKAVNTSKDATRIRVQKIAGCANEIAAISAKLSQMALDGTIDTIEKAELQKMMTPMFEQVLDVI